MQSFSDIPVSCFFQLIKFRDYLWASDLAVDPNVLYFRQFDQRNNE